MADIESVRLPDNSTFNIKDATALHGTDVVDNRTSTATDKPLSANQGHLMADNLAVNEESGAKNLLRNDAKSSTGDVTFTVNSDKSVTVNGTSSGVIQYDLQGNTYKTLAELGLKANTPYILSGGVGTGAGVRLSAGGAWSNIYAADTEVTFTVTDPSYTYRPQIYIGSGVTLNNVTFKPMIRDARILDNTYAPYAENNVQLTKKTSGLSNKNLIDNPCFSVNQRGATTITSGYGADRWMLAGGTSATFGTNQVTVTGALVSQWRENQLPNGTYTASVKLLDGTIYSGTLTKTNDTDSLTFISNSQIIVAYIPALKRFDLNTANVTGTPTTTVVHAKLELGTVSTLANDVAPDYTTELLKCQRYFVRLDAPAQYTRVGVGTGSADSCGVLITLPVQMRALPTVTFAGSFKAYELDVSNNYSVSSITTSGKMLSMQHLILSFNATGLVLGKMYIVQSGTSNSYIDISAEL